MFADLIALAILLGFSLFAFDFFGNDEDEPVTAGDDPGTDTPVGKTPIDEYLPDPGVSDPIGKAPEEEDPGVADPVGKTPSQPGDKPPEEGEEPFEEAPGDGDAPVAEDPVGETPGDGDTPVEEAPGDGDTPTGEDPGDGDAPTGEDPATEDPGDGNGDGDGPAGEAITLQTNMTVTTGAGDDTLTGGVVYDLDISTGGGDDLIDADLNNSLVQTGAGNDVLRVDGGIFNEIATGDGDDVVFADTSAVSTGNGDDEITAFDTDVDAGPGNDRVTVDNFNRVVFGGSGDDVIDASAAASTDVFGESGNDEITIRADTGYENNADGGAGDDVIRLLASDGFALVNGGDVGGDFAGGDGTDTFILELRIDGTFNGDYQTAQVASIIDLEPGREVLTVQTNLDEDADAILTEVRLQPLSDQPDSRVLLTLSYLNQDNVRMDFYVSLPPGTTDQDIEIEDLPAGTA
jgi:hypothetical protein